MHIAIEYLIDHGAPALAAQCASDAAGKSAYTELLAMLNHTGPLLERQARACELICRHLAYREIERLAAACRAHMAKQSVYTSKEGVRQLIYNMGQTK